MPAEGQLRPEVNQELPRTVLRVFLVETRQALETVANLADVLEQEVIFNFYCTDVDAETAAAQPAESVYAAAVKAAT